MKWLGILCLLLVFIAGCTKDIFNEKEVAEEEQITIVVPSSKGGGWDITARAMQSILTNKKIINQPIEVINIIGEGGEQGWKYVSSQKGHVLAMNSSLIITNHLLGKSQLTYKDFTPLATLASEWEVVIVAKDSEFENARNLMAHLRNHIRGYEVGVSPRLGNNDQLSFVLAAKIAGLHPKELDFYVYENSAEVVDALLRKEIDVATMSLSEAKKYYDFNQINILAISSNKRLEEFPEIPTWKEQGFNVVLQHWRGVMGSPGMKESEVAYWDEALSKMTETVEWERTLKKYNWTSFYNDSEQTNLFLKEQSRYYEELMDPFLSQ
ncbi:tripartite tricarboxylate transporter substrate binding protein [Niallia endozanthoxylica]|uniref:Tripartite tricarboxylate transporter substrate binding protein n=1 Tax=Niallia endozanthoxylica TaxID=2036016 RepID=A0A5J5HFF6_9BACI|nr:tripartite tricarboxylate transporter substrate-binding protein [Niallia endozanthoxylica]KAA9019556.1 tripartite tricarboxylate transporter substrate binding protein [Niallia endozanthoxylica]